MTNKAINSLNSHDQRGTPAHDSALSRQNKLMNILDLFDSELQSAQSRLAASAALLYDIPAPNSRAISTADANRLSVESLPTKYTKASIMFDGQANSATDRHTGKVGVGLRTGNRQINQRSDNIQAAGPWNTGKRSPSDQPHVAPLNTASTLPRLDKLRILAAENSPINRIVLKQTLLDEGGSLSCVENGQRILELVASTGGDAWDIVLLNIAKPLIDSLEVTRHLHKLAPDLPIIGLTVLARDEEREKCFASGMVSYLTKPIDLDLLVEAILQHSKKWPTPGSARDFRVC